MPSQKTAEGLVWATNSIVGGVRTFPWGHFTAAGWLAPLFIVFFFWVYVKSLWHFAATSQHPGSSPLRRNQARYVFAAFLIATFGTFDYLPEYGINIPPKGFVFVIALVSIVAYAIVRHQLLDIRIVIRKSLIYSVLIGIITGIYFCVVLIAEKWFQGFMGYRSLVGSVAAGFAITLGFTPLKEAVQRLVDRLFFSGSRWALAEENERLRHELVRAEKLKTVSTLAAGMAHEIKNPLAAIKTFSEFLPERYDDAEFRATFARIVPHEVERINGLVQRLLDFARPLPPKLQPVSLSRIVGETAEFLNDLCVKKRVQIETAFTPLDEVLADSSQLKQVCLNILLNSLEAMEQPGRISIATTRDNGSLSLTISDTGPGIAPKDLPHIFDPFYTTKPTGTGLGLSVVHNIIREHNGRIRIESTPGLGTTVCMTLSAAHSIMNEHGIGVEQQGGT